MVTRVRVVLVGLLAIVAVSVIDVDVSAFAQEQTAGLPAAVQDVEDAVDAVPGDLVSQVEGTVVGDELTFETTNGSSVEIPANLQDPITLTSFDGSELTIRLPEPNDVGKSDITDASVVHTEVLSDVSISVRPTAAAGAQAMVVIDDDSAPQMFDFEVDFSLGAEMVLQDDGSVRVVGLDGIDVGFVEAPWAVDARGVRVPTHYEVHGSTLTQVIDHVGGGFAYPIVGDPKITIGRRIYVYMWGREIFQYGSALLLVGGAAGIAGCEGVAKLPTAVSRGIKALCIGIGGPSVLSIFRAIERFYKSVDHETCYEWTVPAASSGRWKPVRDRNC